ncbi:MAG: iron-sulfur cluster assembly scaffold protein [Sneathiella sp.]|nr:iron-sulfur cluster assembly scaffold protein [Sneathiella sp.]
MIQELYQKNLLRLAADAHGDGVMKDADAEQTLDNPTCGDRITVQIKMADGKIAAFRHEDRSCMLCQAAASLLGKHAEGLAFGDIVDIREDLRSMLGKEAATHEPRWNELEFFQVVTDHKSRHSCVLLPFDALIAAMENLKAKA